MADDTYKGIEKTIDEKLLKKDPMQYVLGDQVPGEEYGAKELEIKSSGSFADLWIKKRISSLNWKPKKIGFYLDGGTGYAEFSSVFISGAIVAESGSIAGWDIETSFLTGSGGIIRTSSGAQRVEISGNTNSINYYSDNVLRISMGSVGTLSESTSLNFYDYLGVLEGSIYGTQEGLAFSDGATCAGDFYATNLMVGVGSTAFILPAFSSSLYLGGAGAGEGISGLFMEETVGAPIFLGTMTTTVRDTIAGSAGGLIYNTTLSKMQIYGAAGWETVTSV